MKHPHVPLLVVVVVAALAVAACAGTSTSQTSTPATPPPGTQTPSAKTAACNGLATVNEALTSLSNVNAKTTVGEVKAAQTKIANTLVAIQTRIPADSGDRLNQIKSANEQLGAKIQGYPDTTPIGQTSAQVQDLKAMVGNAQSKTTQLASTLNCTP